MELVADEALTQFEFRFERRGEPTKVAMAWIWIAIRLSGTSEMVLDHQRGLH